jgi:hypothetical protein
MYVTINDATTFIPLSATLREIRATVALISSHALTTMYLASIEDPRRD